MYRISDDIYNAITGTITIQEVSCDMCNMILDSVKKLYVDPKSKEGLLWERLNSYESLADNNGWMYIQEFVQDDSCIMFFNQDDEKKMFRISNGKDLHYILSETCGYEFSITDIKCSYLLCFTHHDVLMACGNAKIWLSNLRREILAGGAHLGDIN